MNFFCRICMGNYGGLIDTYLETSNDSMIKKIKSRVDYFTPDKQGHQQCFQDVHAGSHAYLDSSGISLIKIFEHNMTNSVYALSEQVKSTHFSKIK